MNKIKHLFAALLIASLSFPCMAAKADYRIVRGSVIDKSDGTPASFATVAAIRDEEFVATAADTEGKFSLKLSAGQYKLKVSLIGYKDYNGTLSVSGSDSELPVIALEPEAETLASARITDKVPLMEMKADKLVMNVSHSAFAQSSNGLDLLKKSPGVTVDKDGNVKLNGNPVSVWIDGRPSHLSGDALTNLLKGTAGTSIDKIELIANPSAKYDAEGQGGIINIKTKRSTLQGLNGTVTLDGEAMYHGDLKSWALGENVSANLNYRSAKNSTTLLLGQGYDRSFTSIATDTEMDTAAGTLKSWSNSLLKSNDSSMQLQLSSDFFLDDKNTVGFIVSAPSWWSRMGSSPSDNISITELDGVELSRSASDLSTYAKGPRYSGNLNWTRVFDPAKASEMTVNLDYLRNGSYTDNKQFNHDYAGGGDVLTTRDVITDSNVDLLSAKLDWQGLIFSKFMLEAGGKWAWSNTAYSNKLAETALPEDNTAFTYSEHIGAAYATISGALGQKLSGKLGLRAEYTIANGDWESDGTTYSNSYLDIFPNLNLAYMASENAMLAFTYSRRINRPRYSQLNPSKIWLDANNTISGNRDLQPEYSDNLTLTGAFHQVFSLSLGLMNRTNLINQIPTFDSEGHEHIVWGNVGRQLGGYLSASIGELPVSNWLTWTLNVTGMAVQQLGVPSIPEDWAIAAQGYTSFAFNLPKDWKIEVDAFGMTKMNWGYFEIQPYFGSSLAVKKSLLDNKLTLSLKMNDIFDSFSTSLRVLGSDATSSTINQKNYMRRVGIGLSWNFGQSQNRRARKVGSLDESSRLGGSGSLGNN